MNTQHRIGLTTCFLMAMLCLAAAQQWNAAPEQDPQKNLEAAWERATPLYRTDQKIDGTVVSNLTDIPSDETRRSRLSFADLVVRSEYSQDLKVRLVKDSTDDEVSEIVEGEQWTGWAELRRLADDPDYRIVAEEEGLVFVVEGMGDTHLEAVARAAIEAAACIRVHVRSTTSMDSHREVRTDGDGEVVDENWSEITRTVGSQTAFQAIKGARVLSVKPYAREGPPFIARVEITPGLVVKRDMRHRLPFLGRLTVTASVRGFTERPYYGHWDTIDEWKTRRLTQEKDACHPDGFKIQDIDLATIGLEIHEAEEIPQSVGLKLGNKEIPLRLVWFNRETLNAGYRATLDLAEYKKENMDETLQIEVCAAINGRDLDSKPDTIAFRHEETPTTTAYEPGPDRNHSLRMIYSGKREPARIELDPPTAVTYAGADETVEFTVRVEDDANRPLEGEKLAPRFESAEAEGLDGDRTAGIYGRIEPARIVTDAEGRAKFRFLPGKRGHKRLAVTVDHPKFVGSKRPFSHVTVEPPRYSFADEKIEAKAGGQLVLRGKVVVPKTGKPLADAPVVFTLGPPRAPLFELGSEGWSATRTNENGIAELAVTAGRKTGAQDVGFGTFTDFRDSEAKTAVTIAEAEKEPKPEDEQPSDDLAGSEEVGLPLPSGEFPVGDAERAFEPGEIDPRLLALEPGKRKRLFEEIDKEARFVANEVERIAKRWRAFPCRQTGLPVNSIVSRNAKAENYRLFLDHFREAQEWTRRQFLIPAGDSARAALLLIEHLKAGGGYVTRDCREIVPGVWDENIRSWDDTDKLWAISQLRRELREFRRREQAVWKLAHEHLRILAEYASLLDAEGAAAVDAMPAELKRQFENLEQQEKDLFEKTCAQLVAPFRGLPRAFCDRLAIPADAKDAYMPAHDVDRCTPISDRYKAVQIDGKWGIVDNASRIIAEPKYDLVEKFNEGAAQFRLGRKWGLMNERGRVIEPRFDEHLLFSQGRAAVRSGEKYGYVDLQGNMVIPAQFDYADKFSDGLARISVTNRETFKSLYGYVDRRGNVVLAPQFRKAERFSDGLALVEREEDKDKVWKGFINKAGAKVLSLQTSEDVTHIGYFNDGMVPVQMKVTCGGDPKDWTWSKTDGEGRRIGGKVLWCYMDRGGNFISPQYDEADDFSDGVARVKVGEKYALINKSGAFVVKPTDFVGEFSEGLAEVKSGELYGYTDRTGTLVIAPQFRFARPFEDGLAEVTVENSRFYIEKTGKLWLPQFESAVHYSDGLAVVWLDSPDLWGVIDMAKTLVARLGGDRPIDWVGDFADGLAPAQETMLSGHIGKDGKFATQPQFMSCGPFSEGLAVVQVRGRRRLEIPGRMNLEISDSFGYSDKMGKVIIEPKFDLACEFKGGAAVAGAPGTFEGRPVLSEVGYRIGFIDKTGQWLDKPPAADTGMKIAFFRVGADGRLEPLEEADLTERVVVEVTCATPRKDPSVSVELELGDATVTVDAKAVDETGTRFRTEPIDLARVLAGHEE